jgi:hypothetical protein
MSLVIPFIMNFSLKLTNNPWPRLYMNCIVCIYVHLRNLIFSHDVISFFFASQRLCEIKSRSPPPIETDTFKECLVPIGNLYNIIRKLYYFFLHAFHFVAKNQCKLFSGLDQDFLQRNTLISLLDTGNFISLVS